MPKMLRLSGPSAMFLFLLGKFDASIKAEEVPLLLGELTGSDCVLEECLNKKFVRMDAHKNIYYHADLGDSFLIDNILYANTQYSRDSPAFAVSLFIAHNYHEFIFSSENIIKSLYLQGYYSLRDKYYILFTKLFSLIKVDNKFLSQYYNIINSLSFIQEDIIKLFYKSAYVISFLYKINFMTKKMGDKRSCLCSYLCIGIYRLLLIKIEKHKKYIDIINYAINEILKIGDEDILVRSANLIALFYIINGKYLNCISLYMNIKNKFSNFYNKNSFVDFTIMTSLCAFFIYRYRYSVKILEDFIKNKGDIYSEHKISIYLLLSYFYKIINNINGYNKYKAMADSITMSEYTHMQSALIRHLYGLSDEYKKEIFLFPYLINPCLLDDVCISKIISQYPSFILQVKMSPLPLLKAVCLRWQGRRCLEKNQEAEGLRLIKQSAEICRELNVKLEEMKTWIILIDYLKEKGKMSLAEQYSVIAHKLFFFIPNYIWPKDLHEFMPNKSEYSVPNTVLFCNSFFTCFQYQNIFGRGENIFIKIIRSFLIAFALEYGIFLEKKDNKWQKICFSSNNNDEKIPENIFDIKYIYKSEVNNSIQINSKKMYVKELKYYEELFVTLYIPVECLERKFMVCFAGSVLDIRISTYSIEMLTILQNYFIVELQNMLEKTDTVVEIPKDTHEAEKPEEEIFSSFYMKKLIRRIDSIAQKSTSVLLLGESGVGKEVLARRLHRKSGRTGDFVGVNIASTPQELFESEFYGHEKGSFTGATYQKKGLFELADKGTLFIDEVGDIPPYLQIKLLRVLQEHQFMRVGGTRLITSDFRLIAATNKNLFEQVRAGNFREDLYYRLNVVPVHILPLRERKDDIKLLALYYLKYFSEHYRIQERPFSQQVMERMLSYDWPGNIRQLKNFVERYCLYVDSDVINTVELFDGTAGVQEEKTDIFAQRLSLRALNDAYFEYMFKEKLGVISGKNGVAAALGISVPTAHSWLNRMKLRDKYQLSIK